MNSKAGLWIMAAIMWAGSADGKAADPVRERIVYTALRPAGMALYLFDAPGAEPRRLTPEPGLNYNPVFSPDGRWVVFTSERRGNPDLFAQDLTKPGPPTLLTESGAMEDAAAFSPDGRRLAFVGTRDGNADIFVMPFQPGGPDASARAANLTRHGGGDFNPAFSPDGTRIAFSSDRDGYRESEIYVMDADGSNLRRLTFSAGWDGSPAWSPEGERIYFYSRRAAGPGIYAMKADGTGEERIVADPAALSPAVTPRGRVAYAARQNDRWGIFSVAPDGSDRRYESGRRHECGAPAFDRASGRMVCHGSGDTTEASPIQSPVPGPFVVDRQEVRLPDRPLELLAVRGAFPALGPGGRELVFSEHFERIVAARPDGSGQRTVFAPGDAAVWRPNWSRDGQWIACTKGPTFGQPSARADIWKFRPDGSGAVNLTRELGANNGFPHFSPDGRRIVFRSGRDGNHEIYLMNADGSGPRRLTDSGATDTMPAYAPDGRAVAFTSARGGDYEIYTLGIGEDGSPGELRRITTSPGFDTHPAYSPDGKWLVFASQRGGLNDEEPLITIFNPQPYGEIYAVRLEDGWVVRLTHNKWEDGTPTWGGMPGDR